MPENILSVRVRWRFWRLEVTLYDECKAATIEKLKKPRRKTPKKNLEARVVRECLKLLAEHPDVVYAERRNTGMVLFQGGGCVKFGHKGAADIWCLYRVPMVIDIGITTINRHVEIECKRADGKGKQTPAQLEFQEFCEEHGIPYLLVTSAKELAKKLPQFYP